MHNWTDNYGYGRGFGGWHLFIGMPLMIIFWSLLVWGVITLVRRGGFNSPPGNKLVSSAPNAQHILDDRLAKGDITEEDYKSRTEALRSSKS